MNLTDLTLDGFVSEIASPSPAPGGGSCAAYSAAVGAALGEMMAHLSFGKKSFEGKSSEDKMAFEASYIEISKIKDKLNILVDKDTQAFEKVMMAFKLPKETEEEKVIRREAVDEATWLCVDIPYQVVLLSKAGLVEAAKMVDIGNQNAITDMGVGVLMMYAGLEGAILNIKVNLGSVMDLDRAEAFRVEVDGIIKEAAILRDEVLGKVYKAID